MLHADQFVENKLQNIVPDSANCTVHWQEAKREAALNMVKAADKITFLVDIFQSSSVRPTN